MKHASFLAAAAIAISTAFLGSADAQTQGVTDDEILISGFGPLTGPASWIGIGIRDGFAMGIEEINNAGGIHGRKIRLVFEDDAYQVAQAQTVVRRILLSTQPFMVYSGTGSTVFVSVADMLRESGIPAYNGFSGSAEARHVPESPNLFHGQAVASTSFVTDIMPMLEELKADRVAVMHDVGEWGRALCQPVIEELKERGHPALSVQNYKVGDTDFSGQLVAIRSANPQVVINCGHFPEASVILRQARELGVKSIFISDVAQANPSVWARAGKATDNWVFNWFSPVFLTDETGPMAAFREKFNARYPNAPVGRPNHADTFAYGDAHLLAKALDDAGRDLTPEAFYAAMKKIKGFQPTPINATADFDNPGNDGFKESVWFTISDQKTSPMGPSQIADIAKIISGL